MKKAITYLYILSVFISCTNSKKEINIDRLNYFENKEPTRKKNIDIIIDTKEIDTNKIKVCDCEWEVKNLAHYLDLTFSNNGIKFNKDTLIEWNKNPKRLMIKSIRLIDFDTIPNEMKIFKNVERISIRGVNSNGIVGLEMFPKLRILETEMLWEFDLSNSPKWLNNIEVIHSNKTKFVGLNSFKQLPNLKELKISFSGFEPFPKDFESLKCLNYFQTGAHRFGDIDLNKINLSNMNCLEYVEFHTWWENLKGIPKGIDNISKVKIHHGNLTKKEKEILKNKTSD